MTAIIFFIGLETCQLKYFDWSRKHTLQMCPFEKKIVTEKSYSFCGHL